MLKAACGVEPIAPGAPGEGLLEGDALPCRILCAKGRNRQDTRVPGERGPGGGGCPAGTVLARGGPPSLLGTAEPPQVQSSLLGSCARHSKCGAPAPGPGDRS